MTDDSRPDPIKPAAVPLSSPVARSSPSDPPRHTDRSGARGHRSAEPASGATHPWLWPALALLVLGVLVVIFALPRWVASPTPAPGNGATPAPAPGNQAPQASQQQAQQQPQQDAEQEAARRDSQPILARLPALRDELEQRAVSRWADAGYREAGALAETGDHHYRQRDFVHALDHYRQAQTRFEQLLEQVEPRTEQAVADGLAALDAGDGEAAQAHFELALAITADHEPALQGLARTETLDEVQALLDEATRLEAAEDFEPALERLEAALALDPETGAAREGRDRLRERIAERRYREALDRGFAALEAGDYRDAREAFGQALEIRPDDSAARTGLNQANNRLTERRVAADLQQARQLEQQERWPEAEALYSRLYRDDPSLVDARVGRLRSAARAELDTEIERILTDPLRLSSESVLTHGQGLLRDARAIHQPGARLRRQISALDQALQQAAIPVPVTLRSDQRTRVTLLRVAELGTLEQRELSLRPGRYVATGSRDGYRDVRVEFEVPPGSTGMTVEVICREPVRG